MAAVYGPETGAWWWLMWRVLVVFFGTFKGGWSKMIPSWVKPVFFLNRLKPPARSSFFCWRFLASKLYQHRMHWNNMTISGMSIRKAHCCEWRTRTSMEVTQNYTYFICFLALEFEETIAGSIRNHLNSYASSPDFKKNQFTESWISCFVHMSIFSCQI